VEGWLGDLAKATIMLFVILDPVAVSPFYIAISSRLPSKRERLALLNRVLLAALAMLLAFAVIGDYLFSLLEISLDDFRVAAGVILMIYAVSSLFDVQIGRPLEGETAAIVPLAVPLLAGPGSISTLLYIKYTYGPGIALASAVINIILAYPILYSSQRILRILGRHGAFLVDKFMSLVLAGFAVAIMRVGIEGMLGAGLCG